jgi:hypothetical protein
VWKIYPAGGLSENIRTLEWLANRFLGPLQKEQAANWSSEARWGTYGIDAMSSRNETDVVRTSRDHFYYGEARESVKVSATNIISMQFEKMRENLKRGELVPTAPAPALAPPKVEKAQQNWSLVSSVGTPLRSTSCSDRSPDSISPVYMERARKHSPVPSHIISKAPRVAQRKPSPLKADHHVQGGKQMSPQQMRELSPAADSSINRAPNPNVTFPERPGLIRTLGSSHSLTEPDPATAQQLHTFRGVRAVSPRQLRGDLHLHHDVFLRSEDDDVVQAVRSISRRRRDAETRYPHSSEEPLDYSLKPDVKGARRTVPSHVVLPRPTTASALRARRGSQVSQRPVTVTGARSVTATAQRRRSTAAPSSAPVLESAEATERAEEAPKTQQKVAAKTSTAALRGSRRDVTQACATEAATSTASTPPAAMAPVDNSGSANKSAKKELTVNSASSAASMTGLLGPSPNTIAHRLSPTNGEEGLVQARGPSPLKRRFNFSAQEVATPAAGADPATPALPAQSATPPAAPAVTRRASLRAAASADRLGDTVGYSNAQKQSPPASEGVFYPRALTAAEHAAALALSCKLTASNLAYSRPDCPPVPPHRGMSRALSQLVYNVRADE